MHGGHLIHLKADSAIVLPVCRQRLARTGEETNAKYPGIPDVIHGNGAIAEVMGHVCGGVIGYPITPSTEISEIYEAFRSSGGCNVWASTPSFFEPEGEHSAQSGALGAALTGGKYVSNASSSQGMMYGLDCITSPSARRSAASCCMWRPASSPSIP